MPASDRLELVLIRRRRSILEDEAARALSSALSVTREEALALLRRTLPVLRRNLPLPEAQALQQTLEAHGFEVRPRPSGMVTTASAMEGMSPIEERFELCFARRSPPPSDGLPALARRLALPQDEAERGLARGGPLGPDLPEAQALRLSGELRALGCLCAARGRGQGVPARGSTEEQRRWADQWARAELPAALRAAGRGPAAAELELLAPIANLETARAALLRLAELPERLGPMAHADASVVRPVHANAVRAVQRAMGKL